MTMPQIAGPLAAALDVVAEGCADLADPWWVFGSAGMALVGVPGLTPPDVDLIVSERDARRLLDRWNTAPLEAAASPLFRSAIFAKAQVPCLRTISIPPSPSPAAPALGARLATTD